MEINLFNRKPNASVGDNVESVDMEMSDEESENKKANRMLMDLRSQDRDMRIPPSLPPPPPPGPLLHGADMDMRLMPAPGVPPSAMVSIFTFDESVFYIVLDTSAIIKPSMKDVIYRPSEATVIDCTSFLIAYLSRVY